MRKLLRTLATLVVVLFIVTGLFVGYWWYGKPYLFPLFLDRMLVQEGLADPEALSGLRVLEPYGIHWQDSKLTDVSPAAARHRAGDARRNLATLEEYDRAKLSAVDQTAYDVARWELKDEVEGEPFLFHDYPVNPLFGVQSETPTFLVTEHVVDTERDARDYIARLYRFGPKFNQVLEGLRKREAQDVLPPRFVIEKTIEQMKGFVAPAPAGNLLVTSFRQKLEKADAIPAARRDRLTTDATAAVESAVYPAYARLIAYYEGLLPKAKDNQGVWALPDGDAYYAWCVKHETTTNLTPDQVHAIGLSEVARIGTEMDAILRAQGYATGTVGERMKALGAEPRFNYPDTEASKAQILEDYQKIIDDMDAGLGPYFHLRPHSKVQVQRVPEFKEKTSPGAYYDDPPLDGSRPGTFWVNLRSVGEIQKFAMRSLAYHEAEPGHHFQIGVAQELRDVPLIQRIGHFTAFVEGWAVYAERVAWEIGFEKDPYDDLGRLQAEMFRAVRLVVDTGMHHDRWTREQAIQYMVEQTGMPQTDVTAEIERYLVWPGQALAYKIGQLKILSLRDEAKTALGDRFQLADFHDVVLGAAALPLDVLERRVRDWIAKEGGTVPAEVDAAASTPER